MKKILLLALISFPGIYSFAQTHPLKSNGQVFLEEHFNWENPADPKGWTAPAGWKIEEHSEDDNGYVWVWTNGSSLNKMIRLNINNHDNRVDGIASSGLEATLGQNFPNPFRNETQVEYQLTRESPVRIEVRDITGKLVYYSYEGIKPAGEYTVTISGRYLSEGMYYYTLRAGGNSVTRKMAVVD